MSSSPFGHAEEVLTARMGIDMRFVAGFRLGWGGVLDYSANGTLPWGVL